MAPMYTAMYSRAIQSCFTLIVSNVDPEEIAGHLYECRLINIGHLEQLLEASITRARKCRILGLALTTTVCTPKRFEDLLSVLQPDYDYIATRLQQYVDNARLSIADDTPNDDPSGAIHHAQNAVLPDKIDEEIIGSFNKEETEITDNRKITELRTFSSPKLDDSCSDHGVEHGNRKYQTNMSNCCCEKKSKFKTSNLRHQIPGLLPPCNHGFKFSSPYHQNMFNKLAALVNSRDMTLFSNVLHKFECHPAVDPDAACIALYLQASCSILNSDVECINQIIDEGLHITSLTKTPVRFIVKLLSLRVWNDLNCGKQPSDLGQIKQLIHQDPLSCQGMVTAWNYVNESKMCMMQIKSCMNDYGLVAQLLDRTVVSYRCALHQFSIDKSHDGPYGFNYAALKLVSALLACDDKLHLVNSDKQFYQSYNLPEARQLLDMVYESEEGSAKTLESLSFIAQADYMFRLNRFKRAHQLAQLARQSAIESHLNLEKICAEIRCELYGSLVNTDSYDVTYTSSSGTRVRGDNSDDEDRFQTCCSKECRTSTVNWSNKRHHASSLFMMISSILILCVLLTISSLWSASW